MQDPTRRKELQTLAAVAAALSVPGLPAAAATQPEGTGWIDTHHHFLPPVYVSAVGAERLSRTMPNGRVPHWTPQAALALMDAHGIQEAVLSISSGPPLQNPVLTLRQCNDTAAALRSQFPGRFGSFASLPLPDVDASLAEIAHAGDQLKADGFILFSNYGGKYLGDPAFEPVLQELNRRKAVVFVHPTRPAYDIAGQPNPALIEFTFDTTRCAFSLIMARVPQRFPGIRFILSHAGGTLPYLSTRITTVIGMEPALSEQVPDPLASIRSFYFDTALSAGPATLAALQELADPSHILFGTDFPMTTPDVTATSIATLRSRVPETAASRAIGRGNAAQLLSRL